MRKGLFLLLVLMSSQAFSQIPSMGWLWWSDLGYFDSSYIGTSCLNWNSGTSTCTSSASLAQFLPDVANVYLATDLDEGAGPNNEGKMQFSTGYWPNYPIMGAVEPYAGANNCVTWSGNVPYNNFTCNETNVRPDIAFIFLNQTSFSAQYNNGAGSYWFYNFGLRVMLHEVGHAIGMAHNNSGLSTFMIDPQSSSSPTTLHSLETIWINGKYL
jgi:hypothetical protein